MKKLVKQSCRGFSFVEMVVTLVLLSVLVSLAAPGVTSLFQNNTMVEATNRFLSAITYARSEAVSRNTSVNMCLINDTGTNCDNDGRWEDGWMVWVDTNGSGGFNVGEEIFVDSALPNNFTLRATNNNFVDWIRFSPVGEAFGSVANGAEEFRLCDPSADITSARIIHLNGVGRAWVNRNPGSDACP